MAEPPSALVGVEFTEISSKMVFVFRVVSLHERETVSLSETIDA
jgi:hypothetical protein